MLDQVRSNEMPPEEKPRPAAKDLDTLTTWIGDAMNWADSRRAKDPGYVLPQRLNRSEYNNTVRDLTGLTIQPADAFPQDDSGYGFDNIADVLTMSPLLAEKYLDAAELIIETGFGKTPEAKPAAGVGDIADGRFTVKGKKEAVKIEAGTLTFYENGEAVFSLDCAAGTEYELKMLGYQQKAGDDAAVLAVRVDGKELTTVKVESVKAKPQAISYKFKATAAKHEIGLAYTNDFYDQKTKGDRNLYLMQVKALGQAAAPPPAPLNVPPAFAKMVLIATPAKSTGADERVAAEAIIKNFATRAFRRQAFPDEVTKLLALYDAGKKSGGTYAFGLKRALAACLVSPSFLFRVQAVAPRASGAWELNDYEIASRLSYFLWSSMPDETLFKLAEEKKLTDPKVREEQVKRMLADPKSRELIENFAGQWLELRNLDEVMLSKQRFPDWGPSLATAMRREGELFFEEIVKQDRSIMDFIDADFLYVNGPLANVYGISGVSGSEFKRVSAKGTKRGGILTMASTLTVTSNPTRTSPVQRGKWILDQVLGVPPPPPPPEVPALADKAEDEANAPLRVRLEKHRADAACAVCHARLDGYGLALENFDAMGRWREQDGKFAVDATAQIPGEESVKGAAGLKELILKRKPQFVRSFANKLLTYALGRGTKTFDRPVLNEIVAKSEKDGYKFSSVVLGIVESDAFLKRRDKRSDEK